MSKKAFLLMLICLFCLANLARWGYRSRKAQPRFVAEGAAHLRYTELVAGGGGIPKIDTEAQYPEGLRVFRETSIAMEYLYGFIFRIIPWKKPDLAVFIRFFTAFFFSLAVFPLSYLSADLWRDRYAGLVTGALFAIALPVVGRSSGFEYIRENVTFPLIVFHVYFLLSAVQRGGWIRRILCGAFLLLSLLSWQGTQFYLVPLLFFLVARAVWWDIGGYERRAVIVLIAFVLAAGIAVPFLREGRFLISVPSALCAAWLAASSLKATNRPAGFDRPGNRAVGAARRVMRAAAALAAFACIIVPGLLLFDHFSTYSHFFGLLLYKLRYINKPADPQLLPFAVRAFWVGPFHSPDPRHLFVFALPLILLLPRPVSRLVSNAKKVDFSPCFTLVFLVVSLFFYLLMKRMLPLFGIFGALAAGGAVLDLRAVGWSAFRRTISAAVLVCAATVFLLQDFAWEGPADIWRRLSRSLRIPFRLSYVIYPFSGDVEGAMLSWIRGNTGNDDVILSLHYISPQILSYTGRPTNLNDFFESPGLRSKAHRFLVSLYSGEDRLLGFCREQSSDYLVLSAAVGCDPTLDSPLYQAGFFNIPQDCAAYRLLFDPARLEHFDLVYENESYRIFKIGTGPSARNRPRQPLFYEKDLLWRCDGDIDEFYRTVMYIYAVTSHGRDDLVAGMVTSAERRLTEALRVFYFYPAWRMLDDLYRKQNRIEEREKLASFAYRFDPNRVDVCLALAECRVGLARYDGVGDILTRCRKLLRPRPDQLRRIRGLESRL